jgi:DNA-binding transcriptional MerR regulator
VAKATGVKPYVLRYWENEFRLVRPQKSKAGQRLYQRKDIDLLLEIKRLLYDEKYTISGAKKQLKYLRGSSEKQLSLDFEGKAADGEPREPQGSPPPPLPREVVERIAREVEAIFELVREDESVR